jgi:hypothetical protein
VRGHSLCDPHSTTAGPAELADICDAFPVIAVYDKIYAASDLFSKPINRILCFGNIRITWRRALVC